MFKRHPQEIADVLRQFMRSRGLETPLLQRRLIESWDEVAGTVVARYTEEKRIKNQTLWVKISNPAVRADLQMRLSSVVSELNKKAGAQIITNIRLF